MGSIHWHRYQIMLAQNYLHDHDGIYDLLSESLHIHKDEYADEVERERILVSSDFQDISSEKNQKNI